MFRKFSTQVCLVVIKKCTTVVYRFILNDNGVSCDDIKGEYCEQSLW